jgi:hypothetical protein
MRLLSSSHPIDCDVYVAIITSDYQVRTRWGWTGFDNASWDKTQLASLLFPAMRVDVNHKRGATRSGYIVGLTLGTASDGARLQADWTAPRPMDYVLAALALPIDGVAAQYARSRLARDGRVGISIEHGGRKPRRVIGPCVTVTSSPMNKDCWVILDDTGRRPGRPLAPSVMADAEQLLADTLSLPATAWHAIVTA